MLVCSAASDTLRPLGPCVASGKDTSGVQDNFVTSCKTCPLVAGVQKQAVLFQEQTKSSLESHILPGAELGREATTMKWERSFSHLCVTRDSRLATSTCSCVPWSCKSDNVHSVVVGVVGQRATIEPCLHCGKGRQRHPSGKSGRGKPDKLGHMGSYEKHNRISFWATGPSEDQYSSNFLMDSCLHLKSFRVI